LETLHSVVIFMVMIYEQIRQNIVYTLIINKNHI
jgi:hypothetical protein